MKSSQRGEIVPQIVPRLRQKHYGGQARLDLPKDFDFEIVPRPVKPSDFEGRVIDPLGDRIMAGQNHVRLAESNVEGREPRLIKEGYTHGLKPKLGGGFSRDVVTKRILPSGVAIF